MNEQQFLRECGKSYPEAMAALAYFRQSVQQRCAPVVQKRIQELTKVLGVSCQDLKLTEYAEPDKLDPTIPDQVYLGWRAKRAENLYFYSCLYWVREPEEDSAALGVAITIWIKDRSKREALASKRDQHCEDSAFKGEPWVYGQYSNVIEFWLNVKESELGVVTCTFPVVCVGRNGRSD